MKLSDLKGRTDLVGRKINKLWEIHSVGEYGVEIGKEQVSSGNYGFLPYLKEITIELLDEEPTLPAKYEGKPGQVRTYLDGRAQWIDPPSQHICEEPTLVFMGGELASAAESVLEENKKREDSPEGPALSQDTRTEITWENATMDTLVDIPGYIPLTIRKWLVNTAASEYDAYHMGSGGWKIIQPKLILTRQQAEEKLKEFGCEVTITNNK